MTTLSTSAATAAGISLRQLDHWVRMNAIVPTTPGYGTSFVVTLRVAQD